ncbi:GNAT family N-acetyltransferase [Roseateles toxinivorans]|nr:GNAT family N-acetyltransferase [Roseateles toxinivorans]
MTMLIPMTEAGFARYLEAAIAGFAQDQIDAGRWTAEQALALSREDFEGLLPQGLATPDQHLFEIQDETGGTTIGWLWFALMLKSGVRIAYVYDLEVMPEHRRQGHARAAFKAMEPLVRALGLASIGLHVFAHNPGAQALYASLGYEVTGINMLKQLGVADGR